MGVQTAFRFDKPATREAAAEEPGAGRDNAMPVQHEPQAQVPSEPPPQPAMPADELAELDLEPEYPFEDEPVEPVESQAVKPPAEPVQRAGQRASASVEAMPLWTRDALEQRLSLLCNRPLSVILTDNGRTMISTRQQGRSLVVRVHHMFLDAPADVIAALGQYLTRSNPSASQRLFAYIKSQRARIRKAPVRRVKVRAMGTHHDLQEILDTLNADYFAGGVSARITWGKQTAPRRQMRRSIKLGSYRSTDALIRIHPVLDAAWVPRFFVEFIVYHEMLHQVVAPKVQGGRRSFHCREFRARERQFAQYAEALAWEQTHLRRLLRS